MKRTDMERRKFMAGFAALSAGGALRAASSDGMIYRTLGRTGEKVSAIGLGGHHIGRPKDASEGIRIIRSALDRGMNFLDNCWDYHDGESEIRMGNALRDGYRQKAFLMTKFDGRTKESTARQIDESLRRLQTDRIDLMQFHENIRMEDPDRFFAPGGSLEALLEAKKAGKIRYIGFTGHKDPAVHLRMLDVAAQHKFHFDTCQMPLNVMDAHFRSFGRHVVPELVKDEIGVLGMKPLGSGLFLRSAPMRERAVTPTECLHFSMSQPTSVVITGCDTLGILMQGLDAAYRWHPMNEPEKRAALARTAAVAAHGEWEKYKTSETFDGTAQHPWWLETASLQK